MFRFLAALAFMLLPLTVASYSHPSHLVYYPNDRMVLSDWVYNQNKKLSHDKRLKIVDSVQYYANEYQLDPLLLLAMMKAESNYKPHAKSGYGAVGLMQVVPRWHPEKIKGRDPFRIDVNIEVGTRIIHDCLEKGKDKIHYALRCYSGGAGGHYHKKIKTTHSQIKEHLRVSQILHDQKHEIRYAFDKPRTTKQPKRNKPVIPTTYVDTITALLQLHGF